MNEITTQYFDYNITGYAFAGLLILFIMALTRYDDNLRRIPQRTQRETKGN